MSERSPPAIGDCFYFSVRVWRIYFSLFPDFGDFICLTHIVLQELPLDEVPIISMLFFFTVISGVVCRVCRVFSYHSEININIQTWYIFLEFEKVNVVLVRTIELMYLVNRLKKRSKCPFYVYFVCLFCVYVPVDCKTTHYFVLCFAQCSWYLDY